MAKTTLLGRTAETPGGPERAHSGPMAMALWCSSQANSELGRRDLWRSLLRPYRKTATYSRAGGGSSRQWPHPSLAFERRSSPCYRDAVRRFIDRSSPYIRDIARLGSEFADVLDIREIQSNEASATNPTGSGKACSWSSEQRQQRQRPSCWLTIFSGRMRQACTFSDCSVRRYSSLVCSS